MTYEECVNDLLKFYSDYKEYFTKDAKKVSDYYLSGTGFRHDFSLNKHDMEVLIDETKAGHISLCEGAQKIVDDMNKPFEFAKDHHYCPKVNLGGSDIAALIVVGCGKEKLNVAAIDYGGDGSYSAYLCGKETEIPAYYTKVFECDHWLKIYDDTSLVFDSDDNSLVFNSDMNGRIFHHFAIYRAADFGTIIQMEK